MEPTWPSPSILCSTLDYIFCWKCKGNLVDHGPNQHVRFSGPLVGTYWPHLLWVWQFLDEILFVIDCKRVKASVWIWLGFFFLLPLILTENPLFSTGVGSRLLEDVARRDSHLDLKQRACSKSGCIGNQTRTVMTEQLLFSRSIFSWNGWIEGTDSLQGAWALIQCLPASLHDLYLESSLIFIWCSYRGTHAGVIKG